MTEKGVIKWAHHLHMWAWGGLWGKRKQGGGTVRGNLPTRCLVLRVSGVPSKSPSLWFEDGPVRAVSVIGELPHPSVKLGLWVMRDSYEISSRHARSLCTIGVWDKSLHLCTSDSPLKGNDNRLPKPVDWKDSGKCGYEQVLSRPVRWKGQEVLHTSHSGFGARHSWKLRAYLSSFHRYIRRSTATLPIHCNND